MPIKEIVIYDGANVPLKVSGIGIELYENGSGTLLASALSDSFPVPGLTASALWGATLTFTVTSRPVDVYFSHATHKYPGNVIAQLNGAVDDRVDVDLLALPTGGGGGGSLNGPATTAMILAWVLRSRHWNPDQKQAVLQLIMNFTRFVLPYRESFRRNEALLRVALNWGEALQKVGIDPSLLTELGNREDLSGPTVTA
jgi:hypothetical protein